MLFLLISAALTGCTGPGSPVENPVTNQAPALKPGVHDIQAVDVRPVSTHEIEPEYPPELGSILTGKAVVVFTVRTDGKVAEASVLQADDVLFGEAAVQAVRKWRFQPAEIAGAPVDCRMTLPFVFTNPYGYYSDGVATPDPGSPPPNEPQRTSVESR